MCCVVYHKLERSLHGTRERQVTNFFEPKYFFLETPTPFFLQTAHEYREPDPEDDQPISVQSLIKDLVNRRQIILPADLRSLSCSLCPDVPKKFELLAQDRYSLISHMKKVHGETDMDKALLEYKCRQEKGTHKYQ